MSRESLGKHSLVVRIAGIFLLLIVLPLLLGLYISFSEYEKGIREVSFEYANAVTEKASSAISQYIGKISDAMGTIYTPSSSFGFLFPSAMDYLSLEARPGLDYSQGGLVIKQFLDGLIRYDQHYIYNAFLVDDSGQCYYANNHLIANNTKSSGYEFVGKPWFERIAQNPSRKAQILMAGPETNDDNAYLYLPSRRPLLLFARNVYDVTPRLKTHRVATLFVSVDAAFFASCFEPQEQNAHSFYVMNAAGEVLYKTGSAEGWAAGEPSEMLQSMGPTAGMDGQRFAVTGKKLAGADWYVFGIVDKRLLNPGFAAMQYNLFFIFLGVLVLVMVAAGMFLRRLTGPLRLILRNMKRIEAGEFQGFDRLAQNDEFGRINQGLIEMADNLSRYIERSYIAELKKREADFFVLQSQINPHFMMNALESIRMHLVNREDTETAQAVQLLARIIKGTMTGVNHIVSVEEEVAFIGEYVAFQQYRFGERISLHVNLTPEAARCRIPRMLLQPLVENCFKHGLARMDVDGRITLTGYVSQEVCHLLVMDNGSGMSPEEIDRVTTLLSSPAQAEEIRHIGLKNINDRIRYYFGETYGLALSSIPGHGMIVEMRLPRERVMDDGFAADDHCR